MDISLNLDQLKEEIAFLKHTKSIKKTISLLSCHSDALINKKKGKRDSGSFEQYSENIKLLMDWVNAVCAFYNKKVSFFVFVLTQYILINFDESHLNLIHKVFS